MCPCVRDLSKQASSPVAEAKYLKQQNLPLDVVDDQICPTFVVLFILPTSPLSLLERPKPGLANIFEGVCSYFLKISNKLFRMPTGILKRKKG